MKNILKNFAVAAFAALLAWPSMAQPMDQVPVFSRFENGYDTYRIPAITLSKEGTLLAFAEARKNGRGDSGNIDMVVKRSTDGGKTWGEMITVWDDGENTVGNPAPVVVRETGRIVLPLNWNNKRVFVTYSDDDGLTWSTPKEITDQVKKPEWTWYANGPCHAIQLQSGRLVVPCNHGVPITESKKDTDSHLIYSDDQGETWHLGANAKVGNECTIAELDNGDLLFNMRTHGSDFRKGGFRLAAVSHDGGLTFDEPYYEKALIEEQCNASMINYAPAGKKTGRIIFCNPESQWWRNNMNLRMSKDNGKTWERIAWVNKGPAGYCDICVLDDGRVGVLYETGVRHYNETISFGTIPAEYMYPEPELTVRLYPEGQNVDKGIVENGQQITLGPGESNEITAAEELDNEGNYRKISDDARMDIYLPENGNGQMVIVTPGGAYEFVAAQREGENVAKWMARRGIATCVVLYRLPNEHPQVPLTDVQNAFRYCRHHADEWGINQIGVMGFSAGGHLAAMASNLYTDAITQPDFSVLVYPVIDLNHHEGTCLNLVGKSKKLKKRYSMQYAVTEQTPRTFLALSQNDRCVNIQSSLGYFNALTEKGVKTEMYIFPQGHHGYGFMQEEILTDGKEHKLGNYAEGFLHNLEIFLNEIKPVENED